VSAAASPIREFPPIQPKDSRLIWADAHQRVFVDALVGLTMRAAVGGRVPVVDERLPNETPSDGVPAERRCIDDTPKISPIV
jgi:hypothetical protein